MKKKIIIALVSILIVLGGFFCWWQKRETPIDKWDSAEVSPEEDYILKETSQEKIVENEKMGLIYEIPKDWILENGNPTIFYSPDTEFKEKTSVILEKGCKIYIYISYIKTNIDTLEKFISADFSKLSSEIKLDESSTVKVNNYLALRNKYHVEKFEMSYISVDFPYEGNLYKILISSPIEEIEACEVKFNEFLETVSVF